MHARNRLCVRIAYPANFHAESSNAKIVTATISSPFAVHLLPLVPAKKERKEETDIYTITKRKSYIRHIVQGISTVSEHRARARAILVFVSTKSLERVVSLPDAAEKARS